MSILNNLKLNKEFKNKQSFLYIANDICKNNDKKILALTSSLDIKDDQSVVCNQLTNELINNGKKVLLINTKLSLNEEKYISENKDNLVCMINIKKDELETELDKYKDKYDFIIINIPSVNMFADALEYTKLCDEVILLEKYRYTSYKGYEKTLSLLFQNKVEILGVITY